jgi:hypothetical protein
MITIRFAPAPLDTYNPHVVTRMSPGSTVKDDFSRPLVRLDVTSGERINGR